MSTNVINPFATLPLSYPDLICDQDVDLYARETTSDLQSLIQDIFHLLKELPGSNPDDPLRGIGIDQYLSSKFNEFQTVAGLIDAQLKQDTRITDSHTTIKADPNRDGQYFIGMEVSVGADIIPLEFGWQNGQFTNLTQGT